IWNNSVIAESDDILMLEGNAYFPADSINKNFLQESDTHTKCPWKGTASYYNLNVDGKINKDAAWYYEKPSEQAGDIKGRIAFWKGVSIED
ncbi:MAG: DUF427 domain-containing protein, partial [Bacteroidales bacterium]